MSSANELKIQKRQTGEIGLLTASGSVDMKTMPALRDAIHDLLARGAKHLVLDLRGVGYIDSAGISVLLSAKRGVSKHGGEVFVVTRQNEVQLALHIVQMDRVVNLVDSVDTALEALLPPASGDATVH